MKATLLEWLAKQDTTAESWLKIALLALLGYAPPFLAGLFRTELPTPALFAILAIAPCGMIWFLALWAKGTKEIARLEAELSKLRESEKELPLSEVEYLVLCIAYDAHPERMMEAEFQKRLGLPLVDVQLALSDLVEREFLDEPEESFWIGGGPNPMGYALLKDGAKYVKAKRT